MSPVDAVKVRKIRHSTMESVTDMSDTKKGNFNGF